MTDLPAEAVEAAVQAIRDSLQFPDSAPADAWPRIAKIALTAAAPLIVAQARVMPAENLQIVNGWLVERGAHDLDYPAGAAYGPYPNSDAEPLVKLDELPGWPGDTADLRAGIEALRDEFRSNVDWSDGRSGYGDNLAWESAADALDALLREGE